MITAGRAHLIEGSDTVQKPDDVVRVVLFVIIVVGIAGRLVVLDLGFGIARVNQCLLEANFVGVVSLGPVVSIVTQRNDRLRGIDFTHPLTQSFFVPGLRSNRPVVLVGEVLVIGHQD